MLTTATLEKTLSLLDEGYIFASITEQTGITLEDVEAVYVVWFTGTTEQLFRELQLAGVLEVAAARLRSGQGWDEGTTGDVLREIQHVYPEHVKKALGLAVSRPIPLTTGDILVATDVFLQDLDSYTLEALRRVVEQGLTPCGVDFSDDGAIVILRFTRPNNGSILSRG
jgi:hypothetical protein